MENHRILNDLCHKMDPTRLTTMAHIFMLGTEEELVTLPDIRSYNLYYGCVEHVWLWSRWKR